MRSKNLAIDLFSGCGGLTQGLKNAGFSVLCGCEIRPEARQAYQLNHPDSYVYTDIRKLYASDLLQRFSLGVGELDLLAACPPCQGFSSMRTKNRAVAEDARNELIFEVARLIIETQPKTVLIENVPRLLYDPRVEIFQGLLKNYHFTPGILDAQDFGVPQRRKRMILIGSKLGTVSLPPPQKKKLHVRDVIEGLPEPDGVHKWPLHKIRQRFGKIVQERISMIQKNRAELPQELQLDCHKRYAEGFRDVYGRMSWDAVAPTMTRSSHNPSKGRFIHPAEDRGLTVYEIMLLQGFPKRYKLPANLGIGKLSSLLGEAFPPPMAEAQALQIRHHLEELCADHYGAGI
jgi:DNA (cytosine-5)-methyltransferase 1